METQTFLAFLALWGDRVNACFEFGGGLFVLNNCYRLWQDKAVKGVSVLSTVVFTLWGIWNLVYYPSLGQWASFLGGLLITFGNILYVGLMIYYVRHPGGKKTAPDQDLVLAPAQS